MVVQKRIQDKLALLAARILLSPGRPHQRDCQAVVRLRVPEQALLLLDIRRVLLATVPPVIATPRLIRWRRSDCWSC